MNTNIKNPQVIGFYDGGKATVPINGQLFNLGIVTIRVSENESAPVDYIAYHQSSLKTKGHNNGYLPEM